MTILECMTDGYLLATGKSTLPSSGSSKYGRLFGFAKKLHRDWQNEPGVDWDSTYQIVSAGTVTATDEFDLDDEINKISKRPGDSIYITTTDDTRLLYKLINASELEANRDARRVALIGQTLKFTSAFTSSDQAFGGAISVPAYIKLDDITSVNDDVLVDNPDWLSHMIAAYYVMTDAQLNYLFDDLNNQVNQLMIAMKDANGGNESTLSDEDVFAAAIGGDV